MKKKIFNLDKALDEIRKLEKDSNRNAFLVCLKLAVIVEKVKEENKQSLLDFYDEFGWSASEIQKRIKIGNTLKDQDPDGHVAALSISHLKQLVRLEEIGLLIIEKGWMFTVKELEKMRKNKGSFINLKTEKLLREKIIELDKLKGGSDNSDTRKKDKKAVKANTEDSGDLDTEDDEANADSDDQDTESDDTNDNSEESDSELPTGKVNSKQPNENPKLKERIKKLKDDVTEIKNELEKKDLSEKYKSQIREMINELKSLISKKN